MVIDRMATDPSAPDAPTKPNPLAAAIVQGFASAGILSCEPDAPLEEVAWLMANNRVHAVVVVVDDAPELPVIGDADLVAAAASGHFHQLTAGDIAGTESVSVGRDEGLDRAAQLLADNGVTHLVVRDERRAPVGILSTHDVARALSGRGASGGTPSVSPRGA
jgi:CBS domain-containing protein